MNDIVMAIILIIGVLMALLVVRLIWCWMTGKFNTDSIQTADVMPIDDKRDGEYSTWGQSKKEHEIYDSLNARHVETGEKCKDNLCGFPECERCAGYKTPYCRFYSEAGEKSVNRDYVEKSDSAIICLHKNQGGMRVMCCDYKTMPTDAIELLLESDSYTEGYEMVMENEVYKEVKKDFNVYCNNSGLNNHYECSGIYIDYTKHQEQTQCIACEVFPWVICEWKGDTSRIHRPREFSSVKLSEAQKRFCESFDREADRNADYWKSLGLR